MDAVRLFLEDLERTGIAQGNFLGLLNVLIGRTIKRADGSAVSAGLNWRETAALLKKVRWSKEAGSELGIRLADLPQRDRQRYWYAVIARAGVDSERATEAGDRLAAAAESAGYVIGPAPRG
jgi:hypothetical protein